VARGDAISESATVDAAAREGSSRESADWIRTLLGTVTPPARLVPEDRRVYGVGLAVYPLGALAYVGWSAVYAVLAITSLVGMSLLAAVVWATATALNRRGSILAAFALAWTGFILHTLVASAVLGWDSGIHQLLFLSPASVFLLSRRRMFKISLAAASGLAYLGLYVALRDAPRDPSLPAQALAIAHVIAVAVAFSFLALFSGYTGDVATKLEASLARAHQRADDLLRNILPGQIADRLQEGERTIADGYGSASVLFSDIVGFTPLSSNMTPERLVGMLNEVFTRMDDLVGAHGLEKIKTTGDAYIVAAGIPSPRQDHAEAMASFALDVLDVVDRLRRDGYPSLALRIGIHSGPLVAGVIGKRKFAYDVWGDTVNTAARMEQHGLPGAIQVSEATYELLKDRFVLEERGDLEVKGKGQMRTYLLRGRV